MCFIKQFSETQQKSQWLLRLNHASVLLNHETKALGQEESSQDGAPRWICLIMDPSPQKEPTATMTYPLNSQRWMSHTWRVGSPHIWNWCIQIHMEVAREFPDPIHPRTCSWSELWRRSLNRFPTVKASISLLIILMPRENSLYNSGIDTWVCEPNNFTTVCLHTHRSIKPHHKVWIGQRFCKGLMINILGMGSHFAFREAVQLWNAWKRDTEEKGKETVCLISLKMKFVCKS